MFKRIGRTGLLACLGLGLLVPVARASDGLQDTEARLKVERQRIERDITQLKNEALSLARKGDKSAAADLLRSAIAKLEDDKTLAKDKRDSLLRTLRLTLRDLGEVGKPEPSAKLIERDSRRVEADRRYYEDNRTKTSMEYARRLHAAGKGADADRLLDDILKRDPNNLSAKAMRTQIARADSVRDARDIRDRKANGFLLVMKGVDESAIAPADDIEYPKDWKERSMRRAKLTEQPLTKEERAILKALDTVVDLNLKDVTFQEFLDYLNDKYGLKPFVSETARKEVNVEYNTPMSIRGRATLRTLLRKALADLGLTYVVKDQTIQVTTPARAREMMTTRSYYLGDLAGLVDIRWGPVVSQAIMTQNIINLVNTITSSIDPQSWEVNGGAGRIWFNPATMTLVVRQSAEVHYMLGNGIR